MDVVELSSQLMGKEPRQLSLHPVACWIYWHSSKPTLLEEAM
jgi:hypothetical protein